ncbi:MAG: c-type cytochrome [Gammaproteobacteria bacterium]|nr:c-type cytochrome [Gammaproteobacteria bacterium]
MVVGSVDWCATITVDEKFEYKPGSFNFGGSFKFHEQSRGWVVAVDADTGAERWKYETAGPQVSGITPTAGGVIFAGDMKGNFFVLDSANGKPVYTAQTGGAVAGGVITYLREGKQYVALTSGNVSRITFGVVGSPTLVIYGLGGTGTAPAAVESVSSHLPDPALGAVTFSKVCAACHGGKAEGGIGPGLTGLAQRMDFAATVQWIENPSAKMPKLTPSPLNVQAVQDVAAYVQGL